MLTSMMQGLEELLESESSLGGRDRALGRLNLFSPSKEDETESTPGRKLDRSILKVIAQIYSLILK